MEADYTVPFQKVKRKLWKFDIHARFARMNIKFPIFLTLPGDSPGLQNRFAGQGRESL
jgi:hypothetical protein